MVRFTILIKQMGKQGHLCKENEIFNQKYLLKKSKHDILKMV